MKSALRPFLMVIFLLSLASFACSVFVPRADQRDDGTREPFNTTETDPPPEIQATQRILTRVAVPTITPPATEIPKPRLRSGLRIAYIDGQRNLWIWDEGQEPLLLVGTNDVEKVRVSPDGERIVYTRSIDRIRESIWVIQPNGSGEKLLLDELAIAKISPVENAYAVVPFQIRWITGTHRLAMSTWPIYDGMRTGFNKDLFILDAESGDIRQVFAQGEAGLFFLSPDGKRVALSHPGQIDLADVDGNNLQTGVLRFNAKYRGNPYLSFPQWSPDSSHLRIAVPPDPEIPHGGTVIWEVQADGTNPLRLGEIEADALTSVSFSPDLSRLTYLRKTGGDAPDAYLDLWITNADGSGAVKKETGQLVLQSWSPDSRRFIYGIGNPPRPMLGEASGDGILLSDIRSAEQIRWIDAERVIFMVRNETSWNIHMSEVGGVSRILVRIPKVLHHPTFEFVR
jgi:dipeptidyl aminopeptidase/acylaminoacyl peptidase